MHSKPTGKNVFSEISGAPLVADTVLPCAGSSQRGRLAHNASCSVSLPWTMKLRRSPSPLPFPAPQPTSAPGRRDEHIDPGPDLGRGLTVEMLMGPEMIVNRPRVSQGPVERRGILDGLLKQQPLHGADEPFDAPVLPRASRLVVLEANPQEAQGQAKTLRGKDGFVVGAQESRQAILTAHGDEMVPDRQRRLLRQSLHAQTGAARMIQDGQHDVLAAVPISRCQQVHSPDQMTRNGPGQPMFQFPSCAEDRIGDIGFADGHPAAAGPAAVKAMGNRPATGFRHQGLQANDLLTNPLRLWMSTEAARSLGEFRASPPWLCQQASQPALQELPQPDGRAQQPASMKRHRDHQWVCQR